MAKNDLLVYQVKVNGTLLNDNITVFEIHVALHADDDNIATITILNGQQGSEDMQLPAVFQPGARIEILCGYGDKLNCIFDGELSAIELKVNHQVGAAFYISAVSTQDYEAQEGSVLTLNYGDNVYQLDGVVHLNQPASNHSYATETYPTETELRTDGTAAVCPEDTITLSGCSQWFDGDFKVKTVVHSLGDGTWEMELVVGD